jgi:threonine aldolase
MNGISGQSRLPVHKQGIAILRQNLGMRIDYRSDTVTLPTPGMKAAMDAAPVGDDVFGEDPSVNALEGKAAAMFGMEAGLFCPSGTMTNQIAIRVHTKPGDEVICNWTSHIYQYEGGGIAANSGASVKLLNGNRGLVTAQMVQEAINPDDVHKARTALVSLENTANRGGGACYDLEELKAIRSICDGHNLPLHLDGARLFNALIAKNQSPVEMGSLFHSISICMSKGLGSPVGSVLLGNTDFIKRARRVRKLFGGGMRQAGSLAAAASYALAHHVERLQDDHRHAALLAQALQKQPWVKTILPVETNILIFEVAQPHTAASLVAAFKDKDVLAYAIAPMQVRLVTHLDISESMIQQTIDIFNTI